MKFFLGRDQADDQEDSGDDEAEVCVQSSFSLMNAVVCLPIISSNAMYWSRLKCVFGRGAHS